MSYRAQGNSVLIAAVLSSGIFAFFTYLGLMTALLVDLSQEFGTTVAATAQLTTITAVSWAVLAPLVGPFSDRLGHRRVLSVGMAIFGVSLIGYSLSHTLWAFVVWSVIAGVGGAMVGPNVLASVADYYSAATYGRGMAAVNTASPLAYLVGVPLVVLIAGNLGWRWSFLSLAFFFFASLVAVVVFLSSPRPHQHQSDKGMAYVSSFVEALRGKNFMPMVIVNTILQGAYWVVATYLAAYLIQSYALSTAQLAPLFASVSVGQLIGVIAGGPLADKFDRIKICASGSILLGVTGLAFILFTQHVWLSVFLGGLFMGFYGASRPAYFSLMALVSSTVRGTVMGIQAVSNHLGRALGAAIGGLVLSLAGYGYLGVLCLILSVVASAMYLYLSFSWRKARGAGQ